MRLTFIILGLAALVIVGAGLFNQGRRDEFSKNSPASPPLVTLAEPAPTAAKPAGQNPLSALAGNNVAPPTETPAAGPLPSGGGSPGGGTGGDATNAGVMLDLSSAPVLTAAEKTAAVKYLTQSAAFDTPSPELITFGVIQAQNGKPQELKDAVGRLKKSANELAQLVPPAAMASFHQQSLTALRQYADLLDQVSRASSAEAGQAILTNEQFNQVRRVGQALIQEIRALVAKNSLTLPAEVLPDTPLPTL